MIEISPEKYQISASVKKDTVKSIQGYSDREKRGFSQMVDILLAEAVEARKEAENHFK